MMKEHAIRLSLALLMLLCMMNVFTAEVRAQETQTLELVRTYQSEEDIQTAYPELFPQHTIRDEGSYISFYDTRTKHVLKQIQKNNLKYSEKKNKKILPLFGKNFMSTRF